MEAIRSVVVGSAVSGPQSNANALQEMRSDLLRMYIVGSSLKIDMLVYDISKTDDKVTSVYAFQCSEMKYIYQYYDDRDKMKEEIQKCVYDLIRKITWPGPGGDRALLVAIAKKSDSENTSTSDGAGFQDDELYKTIDVDSWMDGVTDGLAKAREERANQSLVFVGFNTIFGLVMTIYFFILMGKAAQTKGKISNDAEELGDVEDVEDVEDGEQCNKVTVIGVMFFLLLALFFCFCGFGSFFIAQDVRKLRKEIQEEKGGKKNDNYSRQH